MLVVAVVAAAAAVVMVVVLVVVITGLLKATVTVVVVLVVVVELEVDDVGWWPTAQLVDAAFEGHVSSARELILRCEPFQLLPQEIFTEQLILS